MAKGTRARVRDTADPRSLADQLVRLAADEDTMAEAEALVCGLLAAGSLEPMRKVLDGRDDLPLLVRVLLADAATRTASCSPEEVHELFCEVNQRGRPEWRLWISAISADFSLWRGDLNGVAVAQAALIGAEEHDRGPLHAIARGRLRRLLGLATLLAGFGLRDAADDLVASAQADFEEAGCAEEQAITRGLFATVLILMEGDPGHDRIPLVRESVEELLAMGSDRVLLGWVALGWTSGVSFDFATVRDCLAELDAAPDGAVWPILRHFVSVLRAVLDLNANGPTPGVVATVLAEFRALNSSLVAGPTAAIYVAGVLLDAGAIDAAVEVMEIAGPPDPSISGVTGLYRREIDARIHLLQSPGPAAISTVEAVATEQKLHDARLAGEFLLRCSWDCIRAGLTDDGERLRARGETLLAPDGPPS